MAVSRKGKAILALVAIVLLVAAWQGISYWWNVGYSIGTRTGVVRKISVKGSPVCKYLEGELALQGQALGQPTDLFKFSVDKHTDNNPIVVMLHDAEKNGGRVTLHYRQDRPPWWRCNPSEYFITSVEK